MLGSRRKAGGFLHHGMLGDTYLIYKGRMQELEKEGQSVFKKVRFGEQSHTCSKERKKQEVHCS